MYSNRPTKLCDNSLTSIVELVCRCFSLSSSLSSLFSSAAFSAPHFHVIQFTGTCRIWTGRDVPCVQYQCVRVAVMLLPFYGEWIKIITKGLCQLSVWWIWPCRWVDWRRHRVVLTASRRSRCRNVPLCATDWNRSEMMIKTRPVHMISPHLISSRLNWVAVSAP